MKEPREVYIVQGRDTFFVSYKHRKRGQRYSAAGFYINDPLDPNSTLEQAKAWVRAQPKLKLVDAP